MLRKIMINVNRNSAILGERK